MKHTYTLAKRDSKNYGVGEEWLNCLRLHQSLGSYLYAQAKD
jgi:hypothetical protein